MHRYIIVKKETIERIWKITAESYNEAVEKYALVKKEEEEGNDSSLIIPYTEKEYNDWQVYQEIDIQTGVKKYILKEK